jgi:hypothetical protein
LKRDSKTKNSAIEKKVGVPEAFVAQQRLAVREAHVVREQRAAKIERMEFAALGAGIVTVGQGIEQRVVVGMAAKAHIELVVST